MEYIYVDNSNLFIEGKRASAVANGLARDIYEAKHYNVLDHSYTVDFGRLHEFVAGTDLAKIAKAALFGSRPPPNDSIWTYAKKAGFETILVDRNIVNKEKKVDTGIVSAMVKDAYKHMKAGEDTITLIAGDGDFVPAIHDLRDDGFTVEVVFWDHASRELKEECSKFISLNPHLEHLKLKLKARKTS